MCFAISPLSAQLSHWLIRQLSYTNSDASYDTVTCGSCWKNNSRSLHKGRDERRTYDRDDAGWCVREYHGAKDGSTYQHIFPSTIQTSEKLVTNSRWTLCTNEPCCAFMIERMWFIDFPRHVLHSQECMHQTTSSMVFDHILVIGEALLTL
jgi:hypothetical protein